MRHSPPRSRGCYGRLAPRGYSLGDSDDEYESAMGAASSGLFSKRKSNCTSTSTVAADSQSSTTGVAVVTPGTKHEALKKYWKSCKSVARKVCIVVLTNVIISLFMLVVGIGVSLGPGLHSLLVVEPRPSIDKSLNAFNIPNHIVSRRQDALEVAKKPRSSSNRGKRDVGYSGSYSDSVLEEDSNSLHIPSYHELLSPDLIAPLRSFVLNWNEPKIDVVDTSSDEPKVRQVKRSTFKDVIRKSISRHYDNDDPAEDVDVDEAMGRRMKRSAGKVYGVTQALRAWKLQIVYLATSKEEPNVFTEENIAHVNHVETLVRNHEGFTDFCFIAYYKRKLDPNLEAHQGCAPLNSLMTYFYPSRDPSGRVQYDGLGTIQEPIDRTLNFAMTKDTFFWYVDDKINSTYKKSRLLRTEVQFGTPLAGTSMSIDHCSVFNRRHPLPWHTGVSHLSLGFVV